MKTTRLYSIFIGLFLAQSAHGMHPPTLQQSLPRAQSKGRASQTEFTQTNAEAKLHEQLISEAKALAASKADAKSSMEAKTNTQTCHHSLKRRPKSYRIP